MRDGAAKGNVSGKRTSFRTSSPSGTTPHPTPLRGATFSRKREKGNAGFTLLEVSLALLLIAVLAALSLPGLVRATGPSQLRIAALQVAALLREDRNTALVTGKPVTATVVGHAVRAGASRAMIELPQGTAAGVVDAAFQGIRFYGDGRSSGGTIVVASQSARALVAVSPDTGAIHVGTP